MSNLYQIKFVSLEPNISIQQATNALLTHFKFSHYQAEQFLSGNLNLNSQSPKKVALLHQRFKQHGIMVTTLDKDDIPQTDSSTATETETDKRIVNALDYITTSIIRLEEKIDELARQQQVQNDDDELQIEHSSNWVEELTIDDNVPTKMGSQKVKWLFILLFALLLSLLGVVMVFPDLLPL